MKTQNHCLDCGIEIKRQGGKKRCFPCGEKKEKKRAKELYEIRKQKNNLDNPTSQTLSNPTVKHEKKKRTRTQLDKLKTLKDVMMLPEIKFENGNLPPEERFEPILDALRKDTGAMLYLYFRLSSMGALVYDTETNTVRGCKYQPKETV